VGLGIAAVLAVGPYLVAELSTGFFNTRALFGRASDERPDRALGRQSFVEVLHIAADPSGYLAAVGISGWAAVFLALGVAVAAMVLWGMEARRTPRRADGGRPAPSIAFWLVVSSLAAIVVQASFFVAVNRPLLGRHYTAVLAPFYVIPFAALAAWLLDRLPRRVEGVTGAALGAVCIALLLLVAPRWADAYRERTDWTYQRITRAVTTLCEGGSARTFEGPGFATEAPGHVGVLQFLLTRGFTNCRYDPRADRLLVGGRDLQYPPVRMEPDGEFRLEGGLPPGIAVYRRVR
jgi:hypothetical protein